MSETAHPSRQVEITVDGKVLEAHEDQTVAAALSQHGIVTLRQSPSGTDRGVFCGMGVCYECRVMIDGIPDQRACMTPVHNGMCIKLGLGS